MVITKNSALLLCISNALTDESDSLKSSVTSAAVHAWFEGHIAQEMRRDPPGLKHPGPVGEDELPSPPFPKVDDERLRRIINEALDRFSNATGDQRAGAVAFAAGLAWAEGFDEGQRCPGCTFRGQDDSEFSHLVRRMRMGEGEFLFHPHVGSKGKKLPR